MDPVLVTFTRLENSVVVVVKTCWVEKDSSCEDTTTATVGKEVVKRAFVMVVTGKEFVRAGAVIREILLPGGTVRLPFAVVRKGFSPPRISKGAETAKRLDGLSTPVH